VPAAPATASVFACKTRRTLLDALLRRERTVSDLVGVAGVSQPAVSQQLKVLRQAGLVSERREGRYCFYRVSGEPLAEVLGWVRAYEKFWSGRLEALGRVLDDRKRRAR
jgi:DNA-binding transcriptional ArsR family regulator